MTSASGTPAGCIGSVGSLAGGVAGALPPANGLQASCTEDVETPEQDTPALQSEAATGRIVVQASTATASLRRAKQGRRHPWFACP